MEKYLDEGLYLKADHIKAIMQIEKLLTIIKAAIAHKEISIGANQDLKFKTHLETAYRELAEITKSLDRGY
jgi:hypothetical protein